MRRELFIRILLVLTAGALLLSACAKPTETETPIPEATELPAPQIAVQSQPSQTEPTAEPEPTATATEPPAPASRYPSEPPERSRYAFVMTLDYYSHYAKVQQTIDYLNTTGASLESIPLHVPMYYYADSFRDPTFAGSQLETSRNAGNIVHLELNKPLLPGARTTFTITFTIVVPQREGTYGYTNRQMNLMNWYPYVPAYEPGTGFIVHEPQVVNNMIVGEYVVNEIADFSVDLTVINRPELIEVAASAPMIGELKSGKYRYELELARAFSFSISDSYFINEIESDGVIIQSYSFQNHQETGKAVLDIAANALKLFGDVFYPYPREQLTIVVADFTHNMEMDGMVMISYGVFDFYDGTSKNQLTILAPHEISHQWFYSLVGNDQALEPWLDESLATYCELLYYDRYHPEEVPWWWDMRIHYYEPKGVVDSPITIAGGYVPYRNAVYLKGALFLQELRETIGDEAFFGALKDYVSTNTFKVANRQGFFDAVSARTDVDYSLVIAKYFAN